MSSLIISCSPSPSPVTVAPRAAQVKRFMEWWVADPHFRAELEQGAYAGVASRGLDIDAESVRLLWDEDLAPRLEAMVHDDGAVLPNALVADGVGLLRLWRADAERQAVQPVPHDPRFARWRARQVARMQTALGARRLGAISHMLFACELTDGCSVGCWFCGVDAKKMGDHFRGTAENVRLWDELLASFSSAFGAEASRWGLLFWATDPLDNPDYEIFCDRFRAVFGAPPPTTTALALRDPDRTRRLIRTIASPEHPSHFRFSVLSLKMLEKLHATFTPEELACVQLIPHFQGSRYELSLSGRALRNAKRTLETHDAGAPAGQTIACVSGFLLNLVRQTIQLVTPCHADDRWPLGYWVVGERRFDDAATLREAMESLIGEHMPEWFPRDRVVRFRRDLRYAPLADGVAVASDFGAQEVRGSWLLSAVGALAATSVFTPSEMAAQLAAPPHAVFEAVDRLFDAGVLDEEPEVNV